MGGGIGFNSCGKEYKVVIFYNYNFGKPFRCKILTVKSGADQMTWKRLVYTTGSGKTGHCIGSATTARTWSPWILKVMLSSVELTYL